MDSGLLGGSSLTFIGHATFLLTASNGKRVLVDPWTYSNPVCPEEFKPLGPLDVICITHAHSDHCQDAVRVAKESGATVVCNGPIARYMRAHGVEKVEMMGKGGTMDLETFEISMTQAIHLSEFSFETPPQPGGDPNGFVIRPHNGPGIYFAGDTAVFSDMALIAEIYQPGIAVLPIGDRTTMGPIEAAYACKLLKVAAVVPFHYGTFPMLTGTPEAFKIALEGLDLPAIVCQLSAGDTLT